MLVLTRKQRQQIQIGDSITVTVLRTKGNTVRIGIEAPDGVRIMRSELIVDSPAAEGDEPTTAQATDVKVHEGRIPAQLCTRAAIIEQAFVNSR